MRRILDDGGLKEVIILVSGGVNEDVLQTMMKEKAPIDGFGIGVSLDASIDAPALDCAYKLQEYAGTPRRKTLGRQGDLARPQTGLALNTMRRRACVATSCRSKATRNRARL